MLVFMWRSFFWNYLVFLGRIFKFFVRVERIGGDGGVRGEG